jgi:FkbM family methyltransferase
MSENVFSHSGDIGDIIYALPTIKALGGGKLILYDHPGMTAHGMSEAKVNRLRPLLINQDYIHTVDWSPTIVDSSLNGFRDHVGGQGNLSDSHLATHGLDWSHRISPWLKVQKTPKYRFLFSRSPRYHNSNFPWHNIVRRYGAEAAFVGFPDEHKLFCSQFGWVRIAEEQEDFLKLAQLIAGCELFIGNQSSPLAIAHGLKHNTIMEISPGSAHHHCVFQRSNCIIGWDSKIELPEFADVIPRFGRPRDHQLWCEVYHNEEYKVGADFDHQTTVIDIGAHIGAFSRMALHRKASSVVCVEPSTLNMRYLEWNLQGLNYLPVNAALSLYDKQCSMKYVDDAEGTMLEFCDEGQVQVAGVSIASLVAMIDPSQRIVVKCDAEGGEYMLLDPQNNLCRISEIFLETHDGCRINGREFKTADALQMLQHHGFMMRFAKNGPSTSIIYAHK